MFYNESTNLIIRKVFTMKKFRKILATVMAMTMIASTTAIGACSILGGSRELASIVVTNSSISTSYTLNESVSFEEIVITAKYNDASTENVKLEDVKVYLNDEDITNNLNKITDSVGTKTVVIEYQGKKAMITITVSSKVDDGGNEGTEPATPINVAGFEAPGSYTKHLSQKKAAGTAAYGAEGYEEQFTLGTDMYTAGDDNAFKFLPALRFLNENDEPETAVAFKSATQVSLYNGTEYVALESRNSEEENVVEYYNGEDVYLTANVMNNTYDFAEKAIGQQFKLSVLPQGNYVYDGKAVECEVVVVDGFNVYTAKQLAVIDNDTDAERLGAWDDIKEAEGLTDVNPAAVVLQNDITITANDIPAAFQYTLTQDVVYYKDADAATKADPKEGSKTFLHDWKEIFTRVLENGQSFKMYGNYFNLNLREMPYVSSFVNGESDGFDTASHTTLFRAKGQGTLTEVSTGMFEMKNVDVIGNANISDLVYVTEDGKTTPVGAGGLIFMKALGVNATMNNILSRTSLITFFAEGDNANMAIKNSKAYDSYTNAAYIYGKSQATIENCNFARTGGPLIFGVHGDPEADNDSYPTITADDNCKFQNLVTGNEFWFKSYGADTVLKDLVVLNDSLLVPMTQQASGGQLTKGFMKDGKYNMIFLLMPDGGDMSIISKTGVEGLFSYKGYEVNRIKESPIGAAVHNVHNMAVAGGNPFGMSFNVKNTMAYMNEKQEPTPIDGNPASLAGFLVPGESYFTLNVGSFSVFLEYYDL